MHPILFRIPLPQMPLPLFWVLLAAAGIAAIAAVAQLVSKSKGGAAIAGVIGLGLVGAAFYFKAKTFDLGPVPIYSYGVMLGLSLVVGWYLTLGLAERDGLPKEVMANNYVVTAVAAVVGSRILYILTNLNEFDSLNAMLDVRKGGLVAYGGFLGGFIGSFVYLRQHKIPLLPWADVAVPSLASGLMITRIGCYLFGCDFGKPLSKTAPAFLQKLGTFPHWPQGTLDKGGSGSPAWAQHLKQGLISDDAPSSLPVHPTQIYESLVGLSLLLVLLFARRHQKFRGQIFLIFTYGYGVCRFLLEVLRADDERGSIPPSLPEHILIPGALLLLALGWVLGLSRMIENLTMRRLTQVLVFFPPIVLFLALRPESFATSLTTELSTSQAVAVSTGLAAAVTFAIYYQAALAHPELAMAIPLPPGLNGEPQGEASNVADADEDEDADKDAQKANVDEKPRKTRVKKAMAKKQTADDAGEEDARAKKARVADDDPKEDPTAAEEG